MKINKKIILKIAREYDINERGGTDRGMIDDELAEIIAKFVNKKLNEDN